ncbi:hypothetical protein PF008_g440 [Phytophthora fragariae]|uniref:Uncharacterized protein n=1 Tax=Phytophthora fragariae TaxID=53985 RepID=A0A6G0SMZ6_9STRA|nr:hypothetical protein PF008_g440 [Phytophthora fragariae]
MPFTPPSDGPFLLYIRSLKESEAQTTEVTLEAIWLKLAETKARFVSAGEEREAASKALIQMESHSRRGVDAEDRQKSERDAELEIELSVLAEQLQAATAKLEASSTEAGDVLTVLRSEKSAIMV